MTFYRIIGILLVIIKNTIRKHISKYHDEIHYELKTINTHNAHAMLNHVTCNPVSTFLQSKYSVLFIGI